MAFLYGKFVLDPPIRAPGVEPENQLAQIIAKLRETTSIRAHPLRLPLVLLHNHLDRLSYFTTERIDPDILAAESLLGHTKAGRLQYSQRSSKYPSKSNKRTIPNPEAFSTITELLNTTLTQCIFITRCSVWEMELHDFLRQILVDETLNGLLSQEALDCERLVSEALAYMRHNISSTSQYIAQMKARAQTQLDVV
jgi:hypothetical protein